MCDAVDNVGNQIDDLCEVHVRVVDDREDVAEAGEDLQAIVEADDAVVARIGLDAALGLNVSACRRDGAALAAHNLRSQLRTIG